MTAPARRSRRRDRGGGSDTLARLTAAREQLDADVAERRRREDALLADYAAAADAAGNVIARRDAALAELDRQAAQLRERAQQDLAVIEAGQGSILVALHEHRPAEELAQLVGLSRKRVRAILQAHRASGAGAGAPPMESVPAPPPLSPPGAPTDSGGAFIPAGDGATSAAASAADPGVRTGDLPE